MTTPNLVFPTLRNQYAAWQSVNTALARVDALLQLKVLDRDLNDPPVTPADGDRYIIGPIPTGAWAANAGKIAYYSNGAWYIVTPREGFRLWIADEDVWARYTDASLWAIDNGVKALTDAATITPDINDGSVFTVTLGGNRTIAAPLHPVPGKRITFLLKQDGTGTRLITWNAVFRFTAATAPTLTTTAAKTDRISFVYNSVDSKWDHDGQSLNL
jgi:hypothetical protein